MKLKSVKIENFRAIDSLQWNLDSQVTALHGSNAIGKTSVLRAIAVGLGAVSTLLPEVSGNGFQRKDCRDGRSTRVSVTTLDGITWQRHLGLVGRTGFISANGRIEQIPKSPLSELKRWLDLKFLRDSRTPADLPILAFYGSDRKFPLHAKQRNPSNKPPTSRYAALSGALCACTKFNGFSDWLCSEKIEGVSEHAKQHDCKFYNKRRSTVRQAVCSMLDNLSEFSEEFHPFLSVSTDQNLQEPQIGHKIDRLGGGHKAVALLTADLAWRMAQGNSHNTNPLESEAICLIDEVELHLHPIWQQRILSDLMRTFPNTQFIVSTNSPQILSTLKPEQIVELWRENDQITAGATTAPTYGAQAGDVLKVVMGVDERPRGNEFTERLARYTDLVADGEGESPEGLQLRHSLENLSPRDPALDRADIEMRRRIFLSDLSRSL